MSNSDKFDIREWLVPPLLVPAFLTADCDDGHFIAVSVQLPTSELQSGR